MSVVVNGKTKLTYEDYVLFPEDGNVHELIDGDHYMSPAPGTYHQTISRKIQYQLFEQIERTGSGVVFDAPTDVQLSDVDVVQPDLFVIGRARIQRVSPSRVVGAPDLVVEIISEHTGSRDQSLKLSLYERSGVVEYWIVDPESRSIRRYVREGGRLVAAGVARESITYRHEDIAATVDLTQVW
jgi:Uma2 family endonuclease